MRCIVACAFIGLFSYAADIGRRANSPSRCRVTHRAAASAPQSTLHLQFAKRNMMRIANFKFDAMELSM
ncbi:hypothetical protein BTO02_04510 [Paraburkholderia sp. SOS3]|nr:hypothetical protein BTO02_04510 [Paraburkholderia sp. SOS3]